MKFRRKSTIFFRLIQKIGRKLTLITLLNKEIPVNQQNDGDIFYL
jgi:hypothetical protein